MARRVITVMARTTPGETVKLMLKQIGELMTAAHYNHTEPS